MCYSEGFICERTYNHGPVELPVKLLCFGAVVVMKYFEVKKALHYEKEGAMKKTLNVVKAVVLEIGVAVAAA